jgi:hypothetical protein
MLTNPQVGCYTCVNYHVLDYIFEHLCGNFDFCCEPTIEQFTWIC